MSDVCKGRLVVGGKDFDVPFFVKTWKDPGGFSFYGAPQSFKTRKESAIIDQFVLHWDACLSSAMCHKVLIQRALSVHLMLDTDGMVYQCLDLKSAMAYHAGNNNLRSVGVEICNPVLPQHHDGANPRKEFYSPGINSNAAFTHLDFTEIQKKRVIELANAVCAALYIPKQLPRGSDVQSKMPRDPSDVPTGVLTNLAQYKGVLGHYHISDQKQDPGITLWPEFLAANWW